jgi:serine/threonine protein kinase
MTPERWEQVKEIFDAAIKRGPNKRSEFVEEASAGDQEVKREVESLLRVHDHDSGFMSTPAATLLLEQTQLLSAGQRFGHYEQIAPIGKGGMGEVYSAVDSRLGRKIALKLLPDFLTHLTDRVHRFELEARAASALNHPNIVTIHEIGEVESLHFIATEFVDGETLRQQMTKRGMSVRESLDICVQIASALQAAHEAGIVHRDIKPENIMLRRDGIVKVLDFGLAKLAPDHLDVHSQGPTRPMVYTTPGVIMGTVAYMSPEQARGVDVDARTDIWSLGVVLYEMLTGRLPFKGATNSDVIVSILEREPTPLATVALHTPSELQRIVAKSLRKDREERYQTIKDLLVDLKGLRRDLEFPGTKSRVWTYRSVGITVGLLLVVLSGWYILSFITKPGTQPALVPIPLTADLGFEGLPSLSPDGSQVAYASGGPESDHFDIYVKQIGGGPARRLTSDPAADEFPAWSPDGRSIAFIRDRNDKLEVFLIPSSGGPERKIAEIAPATSTAIFNWTPPYLSWTPDSAYLVAPDLATPGEALSLCLFSVITGERRKLTTPPPTTLGDGNPAISPDGRTLAFARILTPGHAQLHLLPLSRDYQPAGEARRLDLPQPLANSPVWTADGREIVCDAGAPWVGGTLWRVAVSGSEKPQPLGSVGEGACCATISRQGNRFVYARWTWDLDIWRTEILHKGKTSAIVKLIASTRSEFQPQYSPDGSKIVFASDRSGPTEIWICNGDGSNPVQLTSLESKSGTPRWFPDGRRIVFDSVKDGVNEIYVMEIATLVPRRLTKGQADNLGPTVSHDGRWVYFGSRPTGNWEIWRMPSEGGEAVQMTRHGGERPSESLDGKVVYYLKGQDVWQVPVSGGEETRVLGPIDGYWFEVTSEGIYFIETRTRLWLDSRGSALRFFRFSTRTAERIADINLNSTDGLSVSPNGQYAIMPMVDPFVSDLMLVENFR